MAKALGLTGTVQNLPDGRVKVIAEGCKEDLKRLEAGLEIKNGIIDVVDIRKKYSDAIGDYGDFYKLVGRGETDERLDSGIKYLKKLVTAFENGFGTLNGTMERMLEKQDVMIDKQDQMLEKQDETIGEIRGLRHDTKSYMDQRFEQIQSELAEIKAAMKEHGIT